ncbi:hypothetical protein ACSVH2_08515 [Flavobacterium sp. RSB2_4_14]|uniref:hypothetical protein n=1 Tax=Flavobacterium sp. RSB2_4_14 TaxID=3447665 RepID=UPI003F3C9C7F
MLLPTDLIEAFVDYFENKIEFHTKYQKYRFNDCWIEEIDNTYFTERVDELIESLMLVLISSNNNLRIIEEVKLLLDDRIKWFVSRNVRFFKSFSKIERFIKEVNHDLDYDVEEKYTINEVLKFKTKPDQVEELLFYFLITNKDSASNYKNKIDFEKVKLLYVLDLFYKSLLRLDEGINKISTAISKYGVVDLKPFLKTTNGISIQKCNVNLDKSSSAFLFKFLMEEGMLYMDNIEHKSHSKIKKFVENNFSYTDSKSKNASPLTDFTKEVSKLKGASNKTKQLQVINLLIEKLQTKKTYLEK